MKSIFKILIITALVASTFAAQSQTVIEYRRPVMIGVKAAANYSSFLKGSANDAALPAPPDGMWGYSFGISFDIPVTSMLDLYMEIPGYTKHGYKLSEYNNQKGTSEVVDVHTVSMLLGGNLYLAKKLFYMGAFFSMDFDVTAKRHLYNTPDYSGPVAEDIKIKFGDMSVLNFGIGMEIGFNIADRVILYGRGTLGLLRCPYDKDYQEHNNVPYVTPGGWQFGVRIPFVRGRS